MATLEHLSADQRAIIELVLRQGRSYDEISELMGSPPGRVRELARSALSELAPASAQRVDSDWRGQVADYVLGQQSGPEARATVGHLKRSEAARTWAISLLDSLDPLYANGTRPTIPEGEAAVAVPSRPRRRRTAEPRRERDEADEQPKAARRPRKPLSADAQRVVWIRRGVLAAGVVVLALAFVPLILGEGAFFLIGGDDDEKKASTPTTAQGEQAAVLAQLALAPLDESKKDRAGIAAIVDTGKDQRLRVVAQGLDPTPSGTQQNPGDAYEVWLYNSASDAKSLGAGKTDAQGNYQGESAAPITEADLRKYKFIDVSREKIDRDTKHSGNSVIRGRIADAQAAQQTGTGAEGTAPQGAAPQGQPGTAPTQP